MEQLIAEWLTRTPCPVSNTLERMWRRDTAARARIVDVARITLEAWDGDDGTTSVGGRGPVDNVRVIARLRKFPSRQLDIGIALAARTDHISEPIELLDGERSVGVLDCTPIASGWMGLAALEDLDMASFLRGETRLRRESGQTMRRRPRRIVPLRRDDLLAGFVEAERVSLGDDMLVLARNELADRADELLTRAARPGFTRHDDVAGLPEGWVIFDNVQVLSSLPDGLLRNQLTDLNVLQPMATSQTVLVGGLRLPGNIRKWAAADPPERNLSSPVRQLVMRI
jgi:hypothetical protein